MSSWAENFTIAATWQLKQQVAYWKSRAYALEYENSVLHDVIRRNQCAAKTKSCTEGEINDDPQMEETQIENGMDDECVREGEDFEVSEEFIQFLTANAKYKEDAKRERQRLKELEEAEQAIVEEPLETAQQSMDRMKELYGDKWQRISALEMSLLSSFIHEIDQNKPSYWPNIPFNFNIS